MKNTKKNIEKYLLDNGCYEDTPFTYKGAIHWMKIWADKMLEQKVKRNETSISSRL